MSRFEFEILAPYLSGILLYERKLSALEMQQRVQRLETLAQEFKEAMPDLKVGSVPNTEVHPLQILYTKGQETDLSDIIQLDSSLITESISVLEVYLKGAHATADKEVAQAFKSELEKALLQLH